MAPAKASTHEVFTDFLNGGEWPTQGLSFFVGIIGSVFAMFGRLHFFLGVGDGLTHHIGCDSAVHVCSANAKLIVKAHSFIDGRRGQKR